MLQYILKTKQTKLIFYSKMKQSFIYSKTFFFLIIQNMYL